LRPFQSLQAIPISVAPYILADCSRRLQGLKDIAIIASPDADKTLDKRFKAAADAHG
jgi:hypothetical protein